MSNDATSETQQDAAEQPDEPEYAGESPDPEPQQEAHAEPHGEPHQEQGGGGGMMEFLGNGGVKQVLLQDTFEDPETGHTYSQADLVADVINVMRMDTKQLCALHGIGIEVNKMTPERAAELLEGVAGEDGVEIIEVFKAIEDDQDRIFEQEMDDADYEQYMEIKRQMLYSVPGGQ